MLTPITVEPLYAKVKSRLLEYIDVEKPKVLPREKDLIKLFNVSRNTVRRAVNDLSNSGVLNPIQGRGTIVLKYAEESPRDIGVICTDSLDVTDPWIAITLKTLKKAAYSKNYNLNMFFCHDYAISSSNSSSYSYLMNSGKLGGLILLSALTAQDIAYIEKIGIPFVTVDFQYNSSDIPSFFIDNMLMIKTIIDQQMIKGVTRFGLVAKKTKVLLENDCLGQNDRLIQNWESLLRKQGLPIPPCDFNLDITDQIRKMYAMPPAERPQVVFTPFIPYADEAKKALSEFKDWNPTHVVSVIKGNDHETPYMEVDPVAPVKKAFEFLLKTMGNK